MNNKIVSDNEISYEQDKKNMQKLQFRINGASGIILNNYKNCLQSNGIQHYYFLYIERCKNKNKEFTTLENYEKDLHDMIEKYCNYLNNSEETISEMKKRNLIYFAYQDLIDDSVKMGSDVIIGL